MVTSFLPHYYILEIPLLHHYGIEICIEIWSTLGIEIWSTLVVRIFAELCYNVNALFCMIS